MRHKLTEMILNCIDLQGMLEGEQLDKIVKIAHKLRAIRDTIPFGEENG